MGMIIIWKRLIYFIFVATIVTQFDHLEEIHGKMFVSHILACITASRYGLSDDEILDIVAHDKQVRILLKL